MSVDEVNLPVLLAGDRWEGTEQRYRFEYDGVTVALPVPEPSDIDRICAAPDGEPLSSLSIDDITAFFDDVGERWRDPSNVWRSRAVELGARITGYPRDIIAFDMGVLGDTLKRPKQYDFIETDLGDPALLDEWRANKAVFRRCWPMGLIVHIMVGNVPLAALFTIYRSLVTKNQTVTKLPARDVVTALCFAQCMHDVDAAHPVVRALSTLYWESGSEVEARLLRRADVVSVWGRGETVSAVKRQLPAATDCIEFGPKRSFGLVLEGVQDMRRAGQRAAHDIALYDQEGCFSLQEVYVAQSRCEEFVDSLKQCLKAAEAGLPRRALSVDAEAHIQRARLEAVAAGYNVVAPQQGTGWTIVVTASASPVEEHPLGRVVYVHPIETLEEVTGLIDRHVQTVAVEPWSEVDRLRDPLTRAGADRLVPMGRMGVFRPGFIHDGFHPMSRMVRWSTVERDLSFSYRFARSGEQTLEDAVIASRVPPQGAEITAGVEAADAP